MMKSFYVCILFTVATCLVSCEHFNQEYLEDSCTIIYRIGSVRASSDGHNITIIPELNADMFADAESRQFYNDVDTSLVYKGWVEYRGAYQARMEADWSLVDWRLTGVEVKALKDFDDNHPVGTSLNDVLEIGYSYKRSFIIVPLNNLQYGTLMLTDYYPALGAEGNDLVIRLGKDDTRALPPCEIAIKDFFGQTFKVRTNE